MNRPVLALLPLAFALAACSSPGTPPADAADTAPGTGPQQGPAPTAQSLSAHYWDLEQAVAGDGTRLDALFPRPELPLRLVFDGDRIRVANGCNHIGGSYTLETEAGTDAGRALKVGDLIQTLMACAEPLMRADAAISDRLGQDPMLFMHAGDPPRLELNTGNGDSLMFVGVPTPDTRHGGPGERVFYEVAAQRVACPHAMIPNYQCLHVREIDYDDNGLKRSEGEWQFLYQDIEGYTHEPGVRNVLRLNRYPITNPPADAPSVAYVLDVVVESERVGD